MIRATYRLQFTPDFGFEQAAALAGYLARLGVSHLYASPYLKARPGSTHGYDIVDHNGLNPELGTEAAFQALTAALKAHGLGQVLDFVPNHMGVGGSDNPFWLDVLEWGPDSEHAGWFDIEWSPDRGYLRDKVLVPFLGDQYGTELEAGKLALKFDPDAGAFAVWAYDTHKLPVSPYHYGGILGTRNAILERLGDAFANLGAWRPQSRRRAEDLKAQLAERARDDQSIAAAIEAAMARFNGAPEQPASWSALDGLIRDQHWRPANFRVAADDINYRRFFNIAELAGIRMELPSVFDHAHGLVFRLLENGTIDGLRIDHIDGLLDPKGYLERLRAQAPASKGPETFYLIVEKILGDGEHLRGDWPIDGTTGYEVTNLLLGILIDPAGEAPLTRLYRELTGSREPFEKILRACKKRIMDNEMTSELAVLAREASRIAQQNNKTSDFTRNILRRAIREIVACFPVYRTYVDLTGTVTADDRRIIDEAIALALPNETAIDPSVFAFLRQMLTGDLVAAQNSGFSFSAVLRFAMKLQQYSGPVMAKGLEDTAFYQFNRFIALNEVGGHPASFGVSLATFHAANQERAARWPRSMLGTSTHDTKRGEDARARLAVVSEEPALWAEQVRSWMALLADDGGSADASPDSNDIYALVQTLIATWPVELLDDAPTSTSLTTYAERLKGAMTKAMREAKVHSTWASPDEAYEAAMLALIDDLLTGDRSRAILPSLVPFARRVARLGVQNSIVQTALKLTMPGVPDIYRGAELWDLSMVDPDNRRPVDYAVRERALRDAEEALAEDRPGGMAGLLATWQDGRIKLAVIRTLLALRRDQPDVFARGSYEPLNVVGPDDASSICAFERHLDGRSLVTAVARFPVLRERQALSAATTITLPPRLAGRVWRDALGGSSGTARKALSSSDLFSILPAAVLVFET